MTFSHAVFAHLDAEERKRLCAKLSAVLTERIQRAPDFHSAVRGLVEELRDVGHSLWSFDENDEMEIWYAEPGLVLTFGTWLVEVVWSTTGDSQAPA